MHVLSLYVQRLNMTNETNCANKVAVIILWLRWPQRGSPQKAFLPHEGEKSNTRFNLCEGFFMIWNAKDISTSSEDSSVMCTVLINL